jgi:hypothetical protein
MNRFGGDYEEKDMIGFGLNSKPYLLPPTIYLCEICNKPNSAYNHVRCSKIKQKRFLKENKVN